VVAVLIASLLAKLLQYCLVTAIPLDERCSILSKIACEQCCAWAVPYILCNTIHHLQFLKMKSTKPIYENCMLQNYDNSHFKCWQKSCQIKSIHQICQNYSLSSKFTCECFLFSTQHYNGYLFGLLLLIT